MDSTDKKTPIENISSRQSPTEVLKIEQEDPKLALIPKTDEFLEIRTVVASALRQSCSSESLQKYVEFVRSEEKRDVYLGIIGLRKLLSTEADPPIQQVIDSGIVPCLKDLLMNDKEPFLQFESAWCLTNIASGNSAQTQIVIEDRGIQLFVRLFGSPHTEIQEQVVWGIGNIAGDSSKSRDMILEKEGMPALIELYTKSSSENKSSDVSMKRNIIWTMSNFCRGKPKADYAKIAGALSVFGDVFEKEIDHECLVDASCGIFYLLDTDGAEAGGAFDKFIEMNLIPKTVYFVSVPQATLKTPCLRIIGSFASANDNKYIEALLAIPGFLDVLKAQCLYPKKIILKETMWTLSNIAAGTVVQATRLIQHSTLMNEIFKILKNGVALETVKEAIFLIANLIDIVDYSQISLLIAKGLPDFFQNVLCKYLEPKMVLKTLQALRSLLKKILKQSAAELESLIIQMETNSLAVLLENLQNHPDNKVADIASEILIEFFGVEDADYSKEEEEATSSSELPKPDSKAGYGLSSN